MPVISYPHRHRSIELETDLLQRRHRFGAEFLGELVGNGRRIGDTVIAGGIG
jgi:hypothetical protein